MDANRSRKHYVIPCWRSDHMHTTIAKRVVFRLPAEQKHSNLQIYMTSNIIQVSIKYYMGMRACPVLKIE